MHWLDFVFAFKVAGICIGIFLYGCTAIALTQEEENIKLFALGWLMLLAAFVVLVAYLHAIP